MMVSDPYDLGLFFGLLSHREAQKEVFQPEM